MCSVFRRGRMTLRKIPPAPRTRCNAPGAKAGCAFFAPGFFAQAKKGGSRRRGAKAFDVHITSRERTAMIWSSAKALVTRDLRLLWRRRGDALQPALFALLVIVLFALALGNEPRTLAKVAPGVLWLAVLLSGLLSLATLFRGDAEDGELEPWIHATVPQDWLVLVVHPTPRASAEGRDGK